MLKVASHRWRSLCAFALITGLSVAGCGGDHPTRPSGDHNPADVKAAIAAVGLNGFRPVPRSAITAGKPVAGVDTNRIRGAFDYHSTRIERSGVRFASIIVVVGDRSVFKPIQASIAAEGKGVHDRMKLRYVSVGDVLVISGAIKPTAEERAQLAKIPALIAYLETH